MRRWFTAWGTDSEDWSGDDHATKEEAIAAGRVDFGGAAFAVAPGHPVRESDLHCGGLAAERIWESALEDAELADCTIETLTGTPTAEELADLEARLRAVWSAWVAPILERAGALVVETDEAELVEADTPGGCSYGCVDGCGYCGAGGYGEETSEEAETAEAVGGGEQKR